MKGLIINGYIMMEIHQGYYNRLNNKEKGNKHNIVFNRNNNWINRLFYKKQELKFNLKLAKPINQKKFSIYPIPYHFNIN